ncbi:MAG: EAL domain-containing protein [Peptococcaceae bacterium]|nr:EAL domain-containing protein [Peptococcaceae bacterium]
MQLLDESHYCLAWLISREDLLTYFQPIVSVKKKSVIGLEALCRGVDPAGGVIPPAVLFELARAENMTVALDRLCRKKALESYKKIYLKNRDLFLFLNMDTSIIDRGVVGSGNLLKTVQMFELNPNNIVVEIVESRVEDLAALNKFVRFYKSKGFLIALDDVGAGHSNLDRIPLVRPDILKIDRSLVSGIDQKYYKQEVFKSLVNLSRKIGALVVAEGVEREEEALTVLELGADLLQGYYCAAPRPPAEEPAELATKRINHLAHKFKSYMADKINGIIARHRGYEAALQEIVAVLSGKPPEHFDLYLQQIIVNQPELECIYVLDEGGVQVTETHCNRLEPPGQRKLFYRPAKKGADHSFKDYYYLLVHTCLNRFTTEPYVSLASGNLCITISSAFTGAENGRYIICADFRQ